MAGARTTNRHRNQTPEPNCSILAQKRVWIRTDSEWLALFPIAEFPDQQQSHLTELGGAIRTDPGAALRLANPITRSVLHRELAPFPALRLAMFAELFAGTITVGFTFLVSYPLLLALMAPAYIYNDGRFLVKDLAIETGLTVFIIVGGALPAFFKFMTPAFSNANDLDKTVAAGYLRWKQA